MKYLATVKDFQIGKEQKLIQDQMCNRSEDLRQHSPMLHPKTLWQLWFQTHPVCTIVTAPVEAVWKFGAQI